VATFLRRSAAEEAQREQSCRLGPESEAGGAMRSTGTLGGRNTFSVAILTDTLEDLYQLRRRR
jgi:hypothetical protein